MSEILNSASDEFGTPQHIFLPLHEEFHFTIDACASIENALLPRYYTKEQDAFVQDYTGERVFCNPPYSRGNVKRAFFCFRNACLSGECQLAVLLIPACLDRDWYHTHRHEFEMRPQPVGRIQFVGGETTARQSHMFVIFRSWKFIWTR
jgi:phage N-6-adenine-methyltransferase